MAQNLYPKARMRVLGLMSGTSLDGLDLCLVEFDCEASGTYRILAAETYAYPKHWQEALSFKNLEARALHQLDEDYSRYLASQVQRFCQEHAQGQEDIDFIGSHGHTWFHEPDKGISYQIGNRPILAIESGFPVICDFRLQDVALGGQGAPLVPIGDRDLFADQQACLNLGGFANISADIKGQRRAWDIAPCNLGMNHYCQQLGLAYDASGHVAASYAHDDVLFAQLNALEYYALEAPKSLGREWLDAVVFPLLAKSALSPEVIIATLNRHCAYQIAQSLNRYQLKQVLISGGGAYNQTLIDSIGIWGSFDLEIAETTLLEFKEALIFAYLAYLQVQGKNNVLASVTGARRDHCSGIRFDP
ncbi:anhydro-N-acetylmuramic acid kinase [Croceimicrobium hydrocarbonivorans]|uniref:Anhydro-N-acetylmuramic acid kinase n=1 Tax=Croceimicrobium hydrocarbonivorans TaxID=2761580 RepID=A0A7H0VH92_9FLAO|nr:anhydro-N-acetylmuramic acid kinase [Croceimicrobium hydrocarbonivorans]QNR25090.1 anhydro-N-acetylmuramic acid kinase [Croceimicrobium hydrocarbonivorans]